MRKSLIMVQYTAKQLFPENKCYHFYSFELEGLTFELSHLEFYTARSVLGFACTRELQGTPIMFPVILNCRFPSLFSFFFLNIYF